MTGATYVVTMTEAGTVKGVYNAQEIVLVSLEQPGQATFQAISNQTVLSDDAAIVNPTDASALFVGASSGGVSSGQVEAVVQDAVYAGEEVEQWTPGGTDNATCNYFEIAAARSFAGSLNEITYRVGWDAGTGMTTEPLWLAIWEQSLDGDGYDLLGVSRNSLTQEVVGTLSWYFDALPLHGRRLRFVPTLSAAQPAPGTSVKLYCRVSASSDGSVLSYNGAQSNYMPVMMMGGLKLTPRYAAQADVSAHVADTVVHVTAAERSAWNAKADSATVSAHVADAVVHVTAAERSAWNAKANAADLTDHVGDSVAHLTEDEHSSLAELIEGGSAITIDDNPISGSANAVSSGGVYSSLHGSGGESTKVGDNASASQYGSVAIGSFARATGDQTISIGTHSHASSNCDLALGVTASASGSGSMAFGYASSASGDQATAVGGVASAAGMMSVAVGRSSSASGDSGVAVGNGASASSDSSSAIGSGAYCGDSGVLALNAGGSVTDGKSTQLYLIPAGSPMAATYTDGEAGLGYVVLDHLSGSVIAQGVVKLSSVCTDHGSDFAPTDVQAIKEY